MERTGATLVPPFDDPRTIAGQGTIAVEILDQLDGEPDLVVVPVGGGGCIAGITSYLAENTDHTAVLGVEPAGAASMMAALAAGDRSPWARSTSSSTARRSTAPGRCPTGCWPPPATWCR